MKFSVNSWKVSNNVYGSLFNILLQVMQVHLQDSNKDMRVYFSQKITKKYSKHFLNVSIFQFSIIHWKIDLRYVTEYTKQRIVNFYKS